MEQHLEVLLLVCGAIFSRYMLGLIQVQVQCRALKLSATHLTRRRSLCDEADRCHLSRWP